MMGKLPMLTDTVYTNAASLNLIPDTNVKHLNGYDFYAEKIYLTAKQMLVIIACTKTIFS